MRSASIHSVVLRRGSVHKNQDVTRTDLNRAFHFVSTNSQSLANSKPSYPSRSRSTSSRVSENVTFKKNYNTHTEISLNRNFHKKVKPNCKMKTFSEGPPHPLPLNIEKIQGDNIYNEVWASKRRYSLATDILFRDAVNKENEPKPIVNEWPEDLLTGWNNLQMTLDHSLKSGLSAESVIKEFLPVKSEKNKSESFRSVKNKTSNKKLHKTKSKRSLLKQTKATEKKSVNYYVRKSLENIVSENKLDKTTNKKSVGSAHLKLKAHPLPVKNRNAKKMEEHSSVASESSRRNKPVKTKVKHENRASATEITKPNSNSYIYPLKTDKSQFELKIKPGSEAVIENTGQKFVLANKKKAYETKSEPLQIVKNNNNLNTTELFPYGSNPDFEKKLASSDLFDEKKLSAASDHQIMSSLCVVKNDSSANNLKQNSDEVSSCENAVDKFSSLSQVVPSNFEDCSLSDLNNISTCERIAEKRSSDLKITTSSKNLVQGNSPFDLKLLSISKNSAQKCLSSENLSSQDVCNVSPFDQKVLTISKNTVQKSLLSKNIVSIPSFDKKLVSISENSALKLLSDSPMESEFKNNTEKCVKSKTKSTVKHLNKIIEEKKSTADISKKVCSEAVLNLASNHVNTSVQSEPSKVVSNSNTTILSTPLDHETVLKSNDSTKCLPSTSNEKTILTSLMKISEQSLLCSPEIILSPKNQIKSKPSLSPNVTDTISEKSAESSLKNNLDYDKNGSQLLPSTYLKNIASQVELLEKVFQPVNNQTTVANSDSENYSKSLTVLELSYEKKTHQKCPPVSNTEILPTCDQSVEEFMSTTVLDFVSDFKSDLFITRQGSCFTQLQAMPANESKANEFLSQNNSEVNPISSKKLLHKPSLNAKASNAKDNNNGIDKQTPSKFDLNDCENITSSTLKSTQEKEKPEMEILEKASEHFDFNYATEFKKNLPVKPSKSHYMKLVSTYVKDCPNKYLALIDLEAGSTLEEGKSLKYLHWTKSKIEGDIKDVSGKPSSLNLINKCDTCKKTVHLKETSSLKKDLRFNNNSTCTSSLNSLEKAANLNDSYLNDTRKCAILVNNMHDKSYISPKKDDTMAKDVNPSSVKYVETNGTDDFTESSASLDDKIEAIVNNIVYSFNTLKRDENLEKDLMKPSLKKVEAAALNSPSLQKEDINTDIHEKLHIPKSIDEVSPPPAVFKGSGEPDIEFLQLNHEKGISQESTTSSLCLINKKNIPQLLSASDFKTNDETDLKVNCGGMTSTSTVDISQGLPPGSSAKDKSTCYFLSHKSLSLGVTKKKLRSDIGKEETSLLVVDPDVSLTSQKYLPSAFVKTSPFSQESLTTCNTRKSSVEIAKPLSLTDQNLKYKENTKQKSLACSDPSVDLSTEKKNYKKIECLTDLTKFENNKSCHLNELKGISMLKADVSENQLPQTYQAGRLSPGMKTTAACQNSPPVVKNSFPHNICLNKDSVCEKKTQNLLPKKSIKNDILIKNQQNSGHDYSDIEKTSDSAKIDEIQTYLHSSNSTIKSSNQMSKSSDDICCDGKELLSATDNTTPATIPLKCVRHPYQKFLDVASTDFISFMPEINEIHFKDQNETRGSSFNHIISQTIENNISNINYQNSLKQKGSNRNKTDKKKNSISSDKKNLIFEDKSITRKKMRSARDEHLDNASSQILPDTFNKTLSSPLSDIDHWDSLTSLCKDYGNFKHCDHKVKTVNKNKASWNKKTCLNSPKIPLFKDENSISRSNRFSQFPSSVQNKEIMKSHRPMKLVPSETHCHKSEQKTTPVDLKKSVTVETFKLIDKNCIVGHKKEMKLGKNESSLFNATNQSLDQQNTMSSLQNNSSTKCSLWSTLPQSSSNKPVSSEKKICAKKLIAHNYKSSEKEILGNHVKNLDLLGENVGSKKKNYDAVKSHEEAFHVFDRGFPLKEKWDHNSTTHISKISKKHLECPCFSSNNDVSDTFSTKVLKRNNVLIINVNPCFKPSVSELKDNHLDCPCYKSSFQNENDQMNHKKERPLVSDNKKEKHSSKDYLLNESNVNLDSKRQNNSKAVTKEANKFLVVSKMPSPKSERSLFERTKSIVNNCLDELNSNPDVVCDFSNKKTKKSPENKLSLSLESPSKISDSKEKTSISNKILFDAANSSPKLNETTQEYCQVRANSYQESYPSKLGVKGSYEKTNPMVEVDLTSSLLGKLKNMGEQMLANNAKKFTVRAKSVKYCRIRALSSRSKSRYVAKADTGVAFNKPKATPLGSKNCHFDGHFSNALIDPNIWKYILLFRGLPISMKKSVEDISDIKEMPDISNRSFLDLFRSVDKSTVIIQKDFYTREKIMKKIRDEENKLKKPAKAVDVLDKTVKVKGFDDVEIEIKSKDLNVNNKICPVVISPQMSFVSSAENRAISSIPLNEISQVIEINHQDKQLENELILGEKDNDSGVTYSASDFEFPNYDASFSKAVKTHSDNNKLDETSDSNTIRYFSNYPVIDTFMNNPKWSKHIIKYRNISKNIVVFNSESQYESLSNESHTNDKANQIFKDSQGANNPASELESKLKGSEQNSEIHISIRESVISEETKHEVPVTSKSPNPKASLFKQTYIPYTYLGKTAEALTSEHTSPEYYSKTVDISNHIKAEPVALQNDSSVRSVEIRITPLPVVVQLVSEPKAPGLAVPKEMSKTVVSVQPASKTVVSVQPASKTVPSDSDVKQISSDSIVPQQTVKFGESEKNGDTVISESLAVKSVPKPSHSEDNTGKPISSVILKNSNVKPVTFGSYVSRNDLPEIVSKPDVSENDDDSKYLDLKNIVKSSLNSANEKVGIIMNKPTLDSQVLKNCGNVVVKLKEDGNDALDISSCDVRFHNDPNRGFSILLADNDTNINIAALVNDKYSSSAKDLTMKDDNFLDKDNQKSPSFPFTQSSFTTSINLKMSESKTEVSVAQNSNTLEPDASIPSVVKSYFQMSGSSSKLQPQVSIVEAAKKNLMSLGGVKELESVGKITGKHNLISEASNALQSSNNLSGNNFQLSSGAYSVVSNSKKGDEMGYTNAKREYELSSISKISPDTDSFKPLVTVSNDFPVINIQLQLAGKGFKPNDNSNQEETKPKLIPPQSDNYEDTIEKMRKKFIANTFRPDSSITVNRLKTKPEDNKIPKTLQDFERDIEEKKPKMENFEYDPNNNPLNEKDLKLLENYFYTKNNPNKKSGLGKGKKSSKYSLGKGKGQSGKKSKVDHSNQVIDSVSKFKELIEKYAHENYMELSQYTFSVVSPSEFANALRPTSLNKVTPIGDISEETLSSYNILKRENKETFSKAVQGIINIDLLANPILKEKYASVPSVSSILNSTMAESSKSALEKWKIRMIALMGEANFQKFYKAQLDQGKDFHESVKHRLMNKTELAEKHKDNLCLKSIDWVLNDISDVAAVESFVVHPGLGYKGIFDCVAKYKGKAVLIEWKHSSKPKRKVSSTYDAPLQMTAYMGALSEDKNYNFQVDSGMVVVAHSDGSPAELFEVSAENCQKYWTQWLKRLSHYVASYQMKSPML